MKVTEVKYMQRFNMGNYEHAEYSISVAPTETESISSVVSTLKQAVSDSHAGVSTEAIVEKVEEPKNKKALTPKGSKSASKAPEVVEEEEETDEDEDEIDEDDLEVDEEEEEEEIAPKKTASKKTPGKQKAAKATPYDRTNDTHKNLVSQLVKSIDPLFMKKNKEESQAMSKKLNGSDFLDADGGVLASFKKTVQTTMKSASK